MRYKILVVDDENANTRLLERLFREHFDVLSAQSGAEALEVLNLYDIALIISDQRMPGMTGVEFLKRSADVRPHCVRILLTGYTDAADLVEALNSGVVYKYVTKPWVNPDLFQTVKRGLSHYETIRAQHRLNLENERMRARLIGLENSLVTISAELVGFKNENSRDAAVRIRDLAVTVGKALRLDNASLNNLSQAAYLHSIADVFVPRGLLSRQDKLTENERTFVVTARERGLKLLENLSDAGEILLAIRHLPEHYDGSGSPHGLGGVQIPLHSQIISVAKAYDEMLFPNSGSGGCTHAEAMAGLHASSGKRFDPAVVNSFCGLMALDQIQKMAVPVDEPAVATI